MPRQVSYTAYELIFDLTEEQGSYVLDCDYNTDLFEPATIQRFLDFYEAILEQLATDAGTDLSALSLLNKDMQQKVLYDFNRTAAPYAKEKLVHQLFEEQVLNTPDLPAVMDRLSGLSFSALNEQANRIAHYLIQEYKIGAGDLIGVLLPRNPQTVACIMGILKAGAAYVPLDPVYPAERLQYIVEHSCLKLVLTNDALPQQLQIAARFLILEQESEQISRQPADNPDPCNTTEDLAYVMYTSGSTGKPKGVKIMHRNITAFVAWCKAEFEGADYEIVHAPTSFCFDLSVYELFFPLAAGKTIRLLEDAMACLDYLATDRKILINTVPSAMEALIRSGADFTHVNLINLCGEPLPYSVKEALNYKRIQVRNLYGPTEDTVYSTCYLLQDEDTIMLIGKPIDNTKVYILDKAMKPLPPGVAGELWLSGDGLAEGYLYNEALTAERFIVSPFEPGERLYKTGDLCMWTEDGRLVHKGRADYQVKIRGFRIELGEIETVLRTYEGIKDAVVIKQGEGAAAFLLAYYTAGQAISASLLQAYLQLQLPVYMLPSYFVYLEHMPMTANGKRDRNALPEFAVPASDGIQVQSLESPTQVILAKIWKEVLQKS